MTCKARHIYVYTYIYIKKKRPIRKYRPIVIVQNGRRSTTEFPLYCTLNIVSIRNYIKCTPTVRHDYTSCHKYLLRLKKTCLEKKKVLQRRHMGPIKTCHELHHLTLLNWGGKHFSSASFYMFLCFISFHHV